MGKKLIAFVIIVLAVALAISIACWFSPPFSTALYEFGVNIIGASIVNGVTGGLTSIMAWGATGLGPAVGVISGTLIVGSILWLVLLRKYVWPHVKNVKQVVVTTPVTLRGGPEPELPQTIEQVPAEVKKEE